MNNLRKYSNSMRCTGELRLSGMIVLCCIAALSGCGALKGGGSSDTAGGGDTSSIVVEGTAPAVTDGSGNAVNDASKECVNTGHADAQGTECAGAAGAGATVNAPAPTIAEPPVAANEPPVPAPAAAPAPAPQPEAAIEVTKGEVVNAPPKLEELTLQSEALFQFEKSDAAHLLPGAKQRLDDLAARIAQMGPNAVSKIAIVGHADRLGLDAANQILSRRRAETVKQYLADKGVSAALLQVTAKGESMPVVQCKGEKPTPKLKACLAPNRRVEVVVYGQK